MRKFFVIGLFCIVSATSTASAVGYHMHLRGLTNDRNREFQVIRLSEITEEMIQDFFTGKRSQWVLECPEGSVLPFHFSVKGEFLAVEDTWSEVKVLKNCFIKRLNDKFLFSTDLQQWKEFQNFFSGKIGVALNLEEGDLTLGCHLELNENR